MSDRVNEELKILKKYFSSLVVNETNNWGLIPDYNLPRGIGWDRAIITICFNIPNGFPGSAPYGIYVPSNIRIHNSTPNNFNLSLNNKPPFEGEWGILSWQLDPWEPAAEISKGSNLLNFVQSFHNRFTEGQ
jgi:hypothetical protein